MPLELISENEMATKSKKVEAKKMDMVVTKKHVDTEKAKSDVPVISAENVGQEKTLEKPISKAANPNIIVKRIYFPGDSYSKNQKEYKKILANYGISWYRPMMKSYVSKEGVTILTGMYVSADQNKKVLMIYEGTGRPATAIVKIMGSGGNFLIDINDLSYKIGCEIEDKDEAYVNNMLLSLQEKGEIYVEKKVEIGIKSEDLQKEFEEKVEKRITDSIEKWIDIHRFTYTNRCECLFWKKGVSLDIVKKFRRWDIEKDIRWAIENGF